MTQAIAKPVPPNSSPDACASGGRSMLDNWKLWLVLAAAALVAGATLNWSWLVAVGVAPLLLAVLPCVAMCALGLCAHKRP